MVLTSRADVSNSSQKVREGLCCVKSRLHGKVANLGGFNVHLSLFWWMVLPVNEFVLESFRKLSQGLPARIILINRVANRGVLLLQAALRGPVLLK